MFFGMLMHVFVVALTAKKASPPHTKPRIADIKKSLEALHERHAACTAHTYVAHRTQQYSSSGILFYVTISRYDLCEDRTRVFKSKIGHRDYLTILPEI